MILSIDVGFNNTGWVVIDELGNIVSCGCIQTKKYSKKDISVAEDTMRRIREIASSLKSIIEKFKIKKVIAELPHGGGKSALAIKSMGIASGIIGSIVELFNLECAWIRPSEVKRVVCQEGETPKDVIMEFVLNKYSNCEFFPRRNGIINKSKFEHIADAICAYLAFSNY